MPEHSSTLGRSTTVGFLWLLLQSLSGRAALFLGQLILAKILVPEAFGAIGLAYTVTALATACVNFGVDDVVLQRRRHMKLWLGTAFLTSFGLACVGMVLMLLAAPIAASIYRNENITGLIVWLAISMPISSLATVPTVGLRADLNFRFLAGYGSLETLGIQAATIALATAGFGAYSFVIPVPLAAAFRVAVLWWRMPTKMRFFYKKAQIAHLFKSGSYVFGTRAIIEFVNQGDYIILGMMGSERVVGIYFFAFRLAAQPVRMLAGNFSSVLFPALTRLNDDRVRQAAAALRAARVLAFTATPLCFAQAAVAPPVFHLVFGERWEDSVVLVQILSLGLPGDAIVWVSGALLVARGEYRRDFLYFCLFSPVFFLLVITGAWLWSALGVAIAASAFYAIIKPINSWLVFRDDVELGAFAQIYVLSTALSSVAVGSVFAICQLPLFADHQIIQIAISLGLSIIIYLGLLRFFAPSILSEVLNIVPWESRFVRSAKRALLGFS